MRPLEEIRSIPEKLEPDPESENDNQNDNFNDNENLIQDRYGPPIPPNLFTLHQFFESCRILGKPDPIIRNHEIRMLTALYWGIGGGSVILRGEAGSAKTRILNAAVASIYGDAGLDETDPDVITITASSSKAQLTETKERAIHNATRCVIPELQAIATDQNLVEMLKRWTEGRSYTYERYVSNQETTCYTLNPLPIITCLAEENEHLKDIGAELNRRVLSLYTRSDKDVNDAVHEGKAQRRFKSEDELNLMVNGDLKALHYYMREAARDDRRVINPGASVLRLIISNKFTSSNSFIDYLLDIPECIAKFYADERVTTEKSILATPGDNIVAEMLAGEAIQDLSIGLHSIGREVLAVIPTRKGFGGDLIAQGGNMQEVSVSQITDRLDAEYGITYPRPTVKGIVERLVVTNFVKKNVDTGRYYRTTEPEDSQKLDIPKLIEECKANTVKRFPKLHKRYVGSEWFLKYKHPFTGEIKELESE